MFFQGKTTGVCIATPISLIPGDAKLPVTRMGKKKEPEETEEKVLQTIAGAKLRIHRS